MLHTTTSVPAVFCHLPSWPTLYNPAEFPCLTKTPPLLLFFIFPYTTYALYLSFISLINEIWTDAEFWLICSSKQWFADVVAQLVKNVPEIQETQVQYLGREHSLKKEMATHPSILAWKIPWTEEPGVTNSRKQLSIWTYINLTLINVYFMSSFTQSQNSTRGKNLNWFQILSCMHLKSSMSIF